MAEKTTKPSIITDLDEIERDAKEYFEKAEIVIAERQDRFFDDYRFDNRFFWDRIPHDLQNYADLLIKKVLALAPPVAEATRHTSFLTSADQKDIGVAIKRMRAALFLREYEYWDTEVIHDEGVVLGVQPAGQSEKSGLEPRYAGNKFQECISQLRSIVELTDSTSIALTTKEMISRAELVAGYRPNTAFIIMWMDPSRPELDDIADTVKRCFSAFNIIAMRADDIQHEDVITNRILEEIKTAEFLFADLTGERPSVYYEVGYAHAIGRRVILYRKKGTKIHFDLAGYNCPEYNNLRELEKNLMKRLSHVTGRQQLSE